MSYEYKFISVPVRGDLKVKAEESFDDCKAVIAQEAQAGWRLKQVVVPVYAKVGVYGSAGYQIIFEREAH